MQLPGVRSRANELQLPQLLTSTPASTKANILCSPCDDTTVSRDDFEVIHMLGEGGFGEVKLVQHSANKQYYAMKAIDKSRLDDRKHLGDNRVGERAMAERDIGVAARQWQCPFIVELYATFQTDTKLYYIFEYCSRGDLFGHLLTQPEARFSEAAVQFYAAEICLALEYLHSNQTIHRDVRLENVMLDDDGHIKLGDFGIAKQGTTPKGHRPSYAFDAGGTAVFYPPEFRRGDTYGFDLDCWQLGILSFILLSGSMPQEGSAWPGSFPKSASPSARQFLSDLLNESRESRLGYPDGASHLRDEDFFRGVTWDDLRSKAVPPPDLTPQSEASSQTGRRRMIRPTVQRFTTIFNLPKFSFVGSIFKRDSMAEDL